MCVLHKKQIEHSWEASEMWFDFNLQLSSPQPPSFRTRQNKAWVCACLPSQQFWWGFPPIGIFASAGETSLHTTSLFKPQRGPTETCTWAHRAASDFASLQSNTLEMSAAVHCVVEEPKRQTVAAMVILCLWSPAILLWPQTCLPHPPRQQPCMNLSILVLSRIMYPQNSCTPPIFECDLIWE